MNMTKSLTAFALCVLLADTSFAINAKDFDADDNGIIDQAENEAFALAAASPPLSNFDLDRDNQLSPSEVAAANAALVEAREGAEDLIYTFSTEYRNGQSLAAYAKDRESADWKKLQPKSPLARIPIKLREKHEDITHTSSAKPASKVKPAQIAFVRDIKSDNEVLTLTGALMWPLKLNEEAGLLGVPSIEINKVTNDREPDKETDSMIVRFGLDWERQGPRPGSLMYWRFNPTWTTDTSTNLDVRGLELQWEPVGLWRSSGSAWYPSNGQVGLRTRLIVHGEYGKVEDNAGNDSLVLGESFSRAGLKFESTLEPRSTDRVALTLGWQYLSTLGGDLRDRKLFSAALSLALDEEQHFTLQSKYTNGDTSAALEDQEQLTLGLGVRF